MEVKKREPLECSILRELDLPAEKMDVPKIKTLLDCLDSSSLTRLEKEQLDRLKDRITRTIYCDSMQGKGD